MSLAWDSEADLDLHVVDPAGVEIWARNINSYQSPSVGTPPDPSAVMAGVSTSAGVATGGRRLPRCGPGKLYLWRMAAPGSAADVLALPGATYVRNQV